MTDDELRHAAHMIATSIDDEGADQEKLTDAIVALIRRERASAEAEALRHVTGVLIPTWAAVPEAEAERLYATGKRSDERDAVFAEQAVSAACTIARIIDEYAAARAKERT